jgi:transcription elongation factor GreB
MPEDDRKLMSKAFTKDDDSYETVIVPERAPLPPGVPNYVTERGMQLLVDEREHLTAERARLNAAFSDVDSDSDEHKKQLAIVNRRLRDLTERIAIARTVPPPARSDQTVRFGATVTLKTVQGGATGEVRRIKLVGVDEAGESASLVAFYAPIAKAILGHRSGDKVTRATESGEEVLEIVDVEYELPPEE